MDTLRALHGQHEPKPLMQNVRWEEVDRRAEVAIEREGPAS
jgi:hypothetical protein